MSNFGGVRAKEKKRFEKRLCSAVFLRIGDFPSPRSGAKHLKYLAAKNRLEVHRCMLWIVLPLKLCSIFHADWLLFMEKLGGTWNILIT